MHVHSGIDGYYKSVLHCSSQKMVIVYNFVAKLELATCTFVSYPTPSLPKPTPVEIVFRMVFLHLILEVIATVLFWASAHPHTTPHHPILTVLWFSRSSVWLLTMLNSCVSYSCRQIKLYTSLAKVLSLQICDVSTCLLVFDKMKVRPDVLSPIIQI